jgi:zinc transport system ATP-binding protein
MTAVVSVRDGVVAYDGRPVLNNVSLTMDAGEVVAILGANASGKSTLVKAVLGLVPLTSGTVELFGTAQRRFRQWQRIGYVPQRMGATSGVPATVGEVVAAGRLARRGILRPPGATDRAAVLKALTSVGLADRISDPVGTLSGGQQQRVLIARALAGEPDLFFLDEPTAGVDLPHQQALADALARLKARGATIVLVAHELGPLTRLVDRAVVMRDGRIAYDGPPLADHEVHHPDFGEAHTHHHLRDRDVVRRHDHTPHVASPLDPPGGRP